MDKLIELSNQVNLLYGTTNMIKESSCLSSESAIAFNEGSNFAYKNVLKLIHELILKEMDDYERKED